MRHLVWYCPACEKVMVEDEGVMCVDCYESLGEVDDTPVDVRMGRRFNERLTEGFQNELQ